MKNSNVNYEVFLDDRCQPPMYGIKGGRTKSGRMSTDYMDVSRLAGLCNEGELSEVHLPDVVEDFMRA